MASENIGVLFVLSWLLGWALYFRELSEHRRRKRQIEYWWRRWFRLSTRQGTEPDPREDLEEALR